MALRTHICHPPRRLRTVWWCRCIHPHPSLSNAFPRVPGMWERKQWRHFQYFIQRRHHQSLTALWINTGLSAQLKAPCPSTGFRSVALCCMLVPLQVSIWPLCSTVLNGGPSTGFRSDHSVALCQMVVTLQVSIWPLCSTVLNGSPTTGFRSDHFVALG